MLSWGGRQDPGRLGLCAATGVFPHPHQLSSRTIILVVVAVVVVVFTSRDHSGLHSVPNDTRTGPTDADTFVVTRQLLYPRKAFKTPQDTCLSGSMMFESGRQPAAKNVVTESQRLCGFTTSPGLTLGLISIGGKTARTCGTS